MRRKTLEASHLMALLQTARDRGLTAAEAEHLLGISSKSFAIRIKEFVSAGVAYRTGRERDGAEVFGHVTGATFARYASWLRSKQDAGDRRQAELVILEAARAYAEAEDSGDGLRAAAAIDAFKAAAKTLSPPKQALLYLVAQND